MIASLACLPENEQRALAEYANRLLNQAGHRIHNLALFGSKARGDADADSDLDVLIVIDRYDSQLDHLITMTAARISLECDTLINTHLVTVERWAEMKKWQATFWQEFERDSAPLLPEQSAA